MLIKNINFNDKKNLFNVILDNDTKFSISYELYENLNLTINQKINTKVYNILEDEDIYQNCKSVAENYINYKMRTVFEVYKKLKQYTKKDSAIEQVINYYKKLDLLNDERYAEEFVKQNITFRNLSKKMIQYKLKQKGIDNKISDKYLDKYDQDVEFENALNLFNKKYKNEDLSDYKIKQKFYRFLSSKGFQYDIINKILNTD